MPKFDNDKSRERFKKTIRERKIYAAMHVEAVLPWPSEPPITKTVAFGRATKHAEDDGLSGNRYFGKSRNPVRRFATFLRENWGGLDGIRSVLQEELGVSVAYGYGLLGIRRAGKKDAEKTNAWSRIVTDGVVEVHNQYATSVTNLLEAKTELISIRGRLVE